MYRILSALAILCPLSMAAVERIDPSRPVTLSNSRVQFAFEPSTMGLSAIIDRASGVNHVKALDGKHLLWEIAMAKSSEQVVRVNNNYKPCTYATRETLADGAQRIAMEWNGLRWWLEDDVITVRVTVELPPDSGIASWRIYVDTGSGYWGLWSVNFPFVNGFPARGEYDIARPVFASGGQLLKKWSAPIRQRYPSGGWPMQFTSLNAGRNGIYFGSRDPHGRPKDFVILPGESMAMCHYPENMGVAGSDYLDYYPVELGVFQGNWVEAARHYRSWALSQKWVRAGRVSQRADIPDILKNVAIWVTEGWNWFPSPGQKPGGRGYISYSGAIEQPTESNRPYLEAAKRMGVPMAMHWYHWHHNKFNHEFPSFLPGRPGFNERVSELVKAGWVVMPYINGYSADLDIPDFASFAPHAFTHQGGGYQMGFYGDSAGRLLGMCPTTYWQDTITALSESIFRSSDINALYIDQVSAVDAGLCFNRSHGHPLGGGRYFTDGYRDLAAKLLRKTQRNGRQPAIVSEGANEVFFDVLGGNLFWGQPSDREIPMMQIVYSGYTLFVGSPCNYHKSIRFFRFGQGQALIDGRQNGWMDVGLFDEENQAKADFLRQCGRYRVAASKFLTYGEMLEPVEPRNMIPTFEDDGFGWVTRHRGTAPLAEGRLWRSEDGRLGVILANYDDQPLPFEFSVDPARFGLKNGRYELSEVRPEGGVRLGTASGTVARKEVLPAAAIRVIEIAAAAEGKR